MSADDMGFPSAVARAPLEAPIHFGGAPVSERRKRRGPGTYDRRVSQAERLAKQRRALIDAGALVLSNRGYANTSVALVLEASELSRGTFYRHFRGLCDLFLAVENDAAELLLTRLRTAMASEVDPYRQLRRSIRAYLGFCSERADLLRVLHHETRSRPGDAVQVRRATRAGIERLLNEGLTRAAELGLIAENPDQIAVEAFIGGVERVALGYIEKERQHEILEALEPLVRLARRVFA